MKAKGTQTRCVRERDDSTASPSATEGLQTEVEKQSPLHSEVLKKSAMNERPCKPRARGLLSIDLVRVQPKHVAHLHPNPHESR